MIKTILDRRALAHWCLGVGLADADLGYQVHSLFAAAFGEAMPRPFSIRMDEAAKHGGHLPVMGYSQATSDDLTRLIAETAEPDVAAAFANGLYGKAMPADWTAGQMFGFEIRMVPTRRSAQKIGVRDDGRPKRERTERDAFLSAVSHHGPGVAIERAAVYAEWLKERLASAANLIDFDMKGFRLQNLTRRNGARSLHGARLPDVLCGGRIQVGDPTAFSAILAGGIGHHRGFGYGMLLLRPA
ncbi:MAG: type I-E CRISPR-associated protein Cas6/Cse3/CasE [Alphaproteobacteria bacterium]|nr:type I-E CRISPR-associated protein Cas6/Cse3/CasE [Alphaproteobacteria bacterium]